VLGVIIGTAAGFVAGAIIMLELWAIARLGTQIKAEKAVAEALRADCANLRATLAGTLVQHKELKERAQTLEDVAKQAMAREGAMLSRPVFLRQEEAMMMAQTIGAMLDRVKTN
jgi:uncharacterized membrane protein